MIDIDYVLLNVTGKTYEVAKEGDGVLEGSHTPFEFCFAVGKILVSRINFW